MVGELQVACSRTLENYEQFGAGFVDLAVNPLKGTHFSSALVPPFRQNIHFDKESAYETSASLMDTIVACWLYAAQFAFTHIGEIDKRCRHGCIFPEQRYTNPLLCAVNFLGNSSSKCPLKANKVLDTVISTSIIIETKSLGTQSGKSFHILVTFLSFLIEVRAERLNRTYDFVPCIPVHLGSGPSSVTTRTVWREIMGGTKQPERRKVMKGSRFSSY